ncbi:kelch-like protein 17 [Ctenocephalides felis]|uniref:kelch-like protein 17 n=1 Tax=Ctenocephalides felis TaxID=7515 RepID=UPI000E6E30E9|nr:kelch-like protein 17 [Ctenocephalides felis]
MTQIIYRLPNYHKAVMDVLNEQRKTSQFCDVTFLVEEKEISAHRNVLCASSQYFRSMFTDHFQESKLDKIPLYDLDYAAVVEILNFIYTSTIQLDDDNDYDIIEAIDILQLYELRPYINHYLKQKLNSQNCLMIYAIANLRSYEEVAKAAFLHILNNFDDIVECDDFKNMSFDLWHKVLNSDVINVANIHHALLKWYKLIPEKNSMHLEKFNVLKSFIPKPIEITQPIKFEINIPFLSFEDFENNCSIPSNNRRCTKFNDIIMVMGGSFSNSCECFPSMNDPWSFSLPLWGPYNPDNESELVIAACPSVKEFASAHTDCEMFLLGGVVEETELSDKCYKYDVRSNSWSDFEKLPRPLKGAAATFCKNKLYITGGTEGDKQDTNTVMFYMQKSETQGKWITVAPMLQKRTSHALCSVNGALYAFGGVQKESNEDDNDILQTVEMYSPELNKWCYVSSMPDSRAMFSSAVLDEFIYIFGGNSSRIQQTENSGTVERYDTLNDRWSQLQPMPLVSSNNSRAVAYRNRIYVIGGITKDKQIQNTVFAYNPRSTKWQHVPPMRFPRMNAAVAVFQLPEHPERKLDRVRATQFRWQ